VFPGEYTKKHQFMQKKSSALQFHTIFMGRQRASAELPTGMEHLTWKYNHYIKYLSPNLSHMASTKPHVSPIGLNDRKGRGQIPCHQAVCLNHHSVSTAGVISGVGHDADEEAQRHARVQAATDRSHN